MSALKKFKDVVKNEDVKGQINFHSIVDLNKKVTTI